jgi:diaminopimelate epimerase
MKLNFYKYQGTGNDFLMIDGRSVPVNLSKQNIAFLCDRRFGVGADGLIILNNRAGYDFEMVYFNSDGGISSMCGNGGRCIVAFARQLGIVKDKARFLAADGDHEANVISASPLIVKLKMADVHLVEEISDALFLNTGSPHYVRIVKDCASINVVEEGKKVRYSERFRQEGTNVNFVEAVEDGFFVRTYERGVEDETLSCGTGVTASALALAFKGISGQVAGICNIRTPGGQLVVHYKFTGKGFSDVWLEGPAMLVFEGVVRIPD